MIFDIHQNATLLESFEGDRLHVIGKRCLTIKFMPHDMKWCEWYDKNHLESCEINS